MKSGLCFFLLMQVALSLNAQQVLNLPDPVKEPIRLSTIAEKVTPVKLQSGEVLVSNVGNVRIDSENIFLSDVSTKTILRFDREGKFINSIGSVGHGPREYLHPGSFCLKPGAKEIYLCTTFKGLFCFDYDGQLKKIYEEIKGNGIRFIQDQFYMSRHEIDRKEPLWDVRMNVEIYDENLQLKRNMLLRHYKAKPTINVFIGGSRTYPFSDVGKDIYVYEIEYLGALETIRDTLYRLENEQLVPAIWMDFPKKKKGGKKGIILQSLFRTGRYVFCVYREDEKWITLCYDLQQNEGTATKAGFRDDLSDGGDFKYLLPLDTNQGLFYFVKYAYELDGMDENDNPVIYLVQLKG